MSDEWSEAGGKNSPQNDADRDGQPGRGADETPLFAGVIVKMFARDKPIGAEPLGDDEDVHQDGGCGDDAIVLRAEKPGENRHQSEGKQTVGQAPKEVNARIAEKGRDPEP